ncbi:hypothetical protein CJ179_38355 [Rhodococcus sp. ACS1]|uniref:hypothetical protein n=1 Tax=Rhodococcus sp. ACS1 TaxID=2028570 RepID=UPI000BB1132E|nr:hypothetical protein [Rhodococcus sp. ACS1]PBC38471.1 hypothetical protein CJ179_38355 [Rhodococcus sp. ACS1]
MPSFPNDGKFIYYRGTGTFNNPRNPAILHILKSQEMKRLMMEYGLLGQALYAKRVVKGEDKRPHQRNFESTRLRAYRAGVESTFSTDLGAKDRYMVDLEAYARHALAREFGRKIAHDEEAPERWRPSRKEKPVSRREEAERVLGGYRRAQKSIVETIEKKKF